MALNVDADALGLCYVCLVVYLNACDSLMTLEWHKKLINIACAVKVVS